MKSLHLPALAVSMLVLATAALSPVARAVDAPPSRAELQGKLEALAQRAAPGTLGITVVDLQSGSEWRVNADRTYPMMSVFKAPVAATVLAGIDRGDISMDQTVTLNRADVHAGSAVPSIGANFRGEHMTFTVRQLLFASVSQSDNTAVDALIKLVGGPAVVTRFLRTHSIEGMRVDLDEAGVGQIFGDVGPHDRLPENESPEHEDQRLQRGYKAFLADRRNRSTPDAAATFLRKLWRNELLSQASTQLLLNLMYGQTVPHRLRDGLPADVRLADKCGTSATLDGVTAAYNDIGILTWPDGHTVIVAAFLTASPASKSERDAIFADLARATAQALHP
jgi:beta-lactamase class A